ncbi:MAG TPA: sugar nucleotide-binding protein, partial [Roseiflexaceae bacterium]|nr:sugar nucleotide-binding protein [Roseiflexaceae bacterium]
QAAASGWYTAATYHARRPELPGVELVPLDVRDAQAAARAIGELRPDAVIHTAYVQDGPDLRAVTVEGAAAVARAARAVGARLVHLSSDVVFDGERVGSYTERDAPAPLSAYGQAKADAERLVAAIDPGALIVRTSLIYGGPAPSKHELLALDAAAGRVDLAFFTDELRCPVAVTDLAAALLELAPLDVRGPLHVAGADVVSRYEFARLVVRAAGGDPARLRAGVSAGSGARRPRNCALDSRLAQGMVRTRLRGAREVLHGE